MPQLTALSIPEEIYKVLLEHLLPKRAKHEEAAFVFTNFSNAADELKLEYRDWYPVPSSGFLVRSAGYIELNDETRARVIKQAHDLNAALVEFHSHLYSFEVSFSWSDMEGFKEFVPHVMWRLKGRPYAAVVVARSGFDALIWSNEPQRPETLSELRVGKNIFRPTGLTLRQERSNESGSV